MVRGHNAYYAVPGNSRAIKAFRDQAIRHWCEALRRRSQRYRLDWKRMGAARKGGPYRDNRVHWVRDVAFDEDRHQMRAGTSAARVLATMHNTAISLLRLAGATNITGSMRWVARDPARAAALMGA